MSIMKKLCMNFKDFCVRNKCNLSKLSKMFIFIYPKRWGGVSFHSLDSSTSAYRRQGQASTWTIICCLMGMLAGCQMRSRSARTRTGIPWGMQVSPAAAKSAVPKQLSIRELPEDLFMGRKCKSEQPMAYTTNRKITGQGE